MPYVRRTWQNAPSSATPLNAAALNNIETGIEEALAKPGATDAAVEAIIADTDSDTYATLTGAIDSVVSPTTSVTRGSGVGIVALGDSNSANYGGSVYTTPDGYMLYALVKSGGRVPFRGTFAAGGYTVQQIRDTFLPQVLALSPRPAAAVILALTNNLPALNFATDTAAYLEIVDGLEAAGIRPIIQTVPPRGDSSAANTAADKVNRWLRGLAASRGLDLSDLHKVVTDPAAALATFRTGYGQTDGVHLSFLGMKKAGELALAPVINAIFPTAIPPTARSKSQGGNIIGALGVMLTDTRSGSNEVAGDGIVDGYRNFGASTAVNTYSVQVDADGYGFQRIVIPATTGADVNLQSNNTPALNACVSPGDLLEFACRVKASGFEANLVAPVTTNGGTGPAWSILVEYQKTNNAWDQVLRVPYIAHCDVDGYIWAQRPVPSDANGNLRISITTTGAGAKANPMTLEVGQINICNLTTYGLA